MNFWIATLLIIGEAIFEGLRTAGYYLAAEIIEAIYLAGIALIIFAGINEKIPGRVRVRGMNLLKILVAYLLLRFAIFDITWNLAAGQNWLYYGSTKLYDRIMVGLGGWGLMMKAIAGFWGITWLLNYRHQVEA